MCLSNFSFYYNSLYVADDLDAMLELLGPIVAGLLFEGDVEAMVEATRILGNVSGTHAGREWIERNKCDEVCIIFLGHEDYRVVYNCFGVILNLTATDHCRIAEDAELCQMLLQHTSRFHTLDLSERPDSDEAQITSLVGKVLLNLSDLV
jgi:hypothetical protein